MEVARAAIEKLQRPLRDIPVRLERLKKSGMRKLSRTDTDSREGCGDSACVDRAKWPWSWPSPPPR